MALPTLSLVVGSFVLLYLCHFVLLGVLRAATGISIQRIGWFSLCRVSILWKDGVRIDVRKIALGIHQPTLSQRTWLSIVVRELQITIDPERLVKRADSRSQSRSFSQGQEENKANGHALPPNQDEGKEKSTSKKRGKTWDTLMHVKNLVKRLHNGIGWLQSIDLVATTSSIILPGLGTLHVGNLQLSVEAGTRSVDRSRLFVHSRPKKLEQRPAEWSIGVRSLLFQPHGHESLEVLDHCVVNVHGFLHKDIEGLRDAAVFVKVGRLNVPHDEILNCLTTVRQARSMVISTPISPEVDRSFDVQQDAFIADERTVQMFADAQEFIASVLRGIREVSIAISLFGMSKQIADVQPTGKPTYLSMSLKEFGLDLYRLDSKIPAHAMYFSRQDVAHQALLSAISLSIGVDDSEAHPERLLYVPMTTATIKTTLPAKLLQFATTDDLADRNANVLYANFVMTSPSLDFAPRHVPLMLALSQRNASPGHVRSHSQRFFSRFLPKASISLSIQEPVVRVALPTIEDVDPNGFDFDLLISNTSSLSLDIQASHSTDASSQYYVSSNLRLHAHKLYYQTASKIRHDLLVNDLIHLRAEVSATPDVQINIHTNFKTFSLFFIRAEITKGIRQILRQARSNVHVEKLKQPPRRKTQNMLRAVPSWLYHFTIEASDCNFELAGLDKRLSQQPRGFAVHLESWSTEYKTKWHGERPQPQTKRRVGSRSFSQADIPDVAKSPSGKPSFRKPNADTNGRRLAIHFKGLESFIIEGTHNWEQSPFVQVPKAEVTLTATADGSGSVLHVMSLIKSMKLEYSLFRHYCVAVALVMLNRTFRAHTFSAKDDPSGDSTIKEKQAGLASNTSRPLEDFVMFDAKLNFIQIKAEMPSDPMMMLHLFDLETARHRYLNPYAKAQIARLYSQAPMIKSAWSRVFSIKSPRIDVRDHRRRHHGVEVGVPERSYDFASDAIRIGVPHQLVVHKIFDNFVNVAKAAQQMHHRFRTNTDEYILAKGPEGPKHVPRISVRTHVLLFELEDSAFEWKIGVIFRAGLVEQKQRLAREEAYRLKCQSLDNSTKAQRANRFGSVSVDRHRSRSRNNAEDEANENHEDRRSDERARAKGFDTSMRYDNQGRCGFSETSTTSRHEAWEKLQKYNAESWKKRVDATMNTQYGQIAELRALLWGLDNLPEDAYHEETILHIPQRPALLGVVISDVNVTIDKPSFPIARCPDFLHSVGKGLPKDTKFSLLMPLHAHFEMGECRASLRDYPLSLLHIPSIKPGQSPRLPSWSLKTDFVIAEEFRGYESTRDMAITVVPADKFHLNEQKGGFAIDVRRTVSPVKTYSDIKMEINTARDTRITWGASYQAAIQDMMQVIEGFTKPQIDPSDRVGFWDKIRLSFHSRINVAWKGDGDVHLMLKGTRDPYVVTGYGAGFVMIWRNNVIWNIHQEDDPCKFMTVDSGDYVLAIPDFKHFARQSPELVAGQAAGGSSFSSQRDRSYLTKVIMKLSGRVRWQAGLVFERDNPSGNRAFDFIPHYDVTLKNPSHVKSLKGNESYDAFRGFRSDHLHLSIAMSAPADRDWRSSEQPAASNYNSVHLTPRFFTHFFAWWGMFSGVMSLPVHQGRLFPGVEKPGKKFGRHVATIKYSLLLSPLFLSHVYKHKEAEEYAQSEDEISATGLKLRLDSFMLDIHQRREEFKSEVAGASKVVTTSGLRINQALLDLVSADIRALSAKINGAGNEVVTQASSPRLAEFAQSNGRPVDVSAFTIPDNDLSWIDIDDFVEVDWTLPEDADPQTKILPLAFAPRFTYRRNTDHEDRISGDKNRHSRFGQEPTHACYIVSGGDAHEVQMELVRHRIQTIDEFLAEHHRNVGEQELLLVRETENQDTNQTRLDELKKHSDILLAKRTFLVGLLEDLEHRRSNDEDYLDPESTTKSPGPKGTFKRTKTDESLLTGRNISNLIEASAKGDNVTDFNNRFIVHNAHIKWTNSLRNIMLRYLHQVSQRRGFIYYQSRKAVRFILDIIEEQRAKENLPPTSGSMNNGPGYESPQSEPDENEIQDRIQQLLNDGKKFVDADDINASEGSRSRSVANQADQHVAHGFVVQNTYHVRLVAPQIQFQSQKNAKSAVLLTARGIRLKVYQIMDEERLSDEVSGLVQRRFTSEMENTQFFVTHKQSASFDFLHMYSDFTYGASLASSWPPWVPLEVVFDFDIGSFESHGFSRVVQKTSASLRYDKYNQLRLKYNDDVNDDYGARSRRPGILDSSMDHLWIDFPRLRALCDSTQYYAIYTIVVDLLMYSDPLEKTRNEKLEKIMLASDFSDLRGAPEMLVSLQERIRQLEEIKTHFHINERFLDRKGWQDRITLEKDITKCEEELFFIMKAITSSQRRTDDKAGDSQVTGTLRYDLSSEEIVWHLTREAKKPLAEFQLRNATFERVDNSDGSNTNMIEIDKIHGLNLLDTAIYPDILTPYKASLSDEGLKMLRVNWHMLDAVAGIPVVDTFEVNVHPIQVQLEYETGRRLFEYIFPGKGTGESGQSPFMVKHQLHEDDEEDDLEQAVQADSRRQSLKDAVRNPAMTTTPLDNSTGAGRLEYRLTPTHILPDRKHTSMKASHSSSKLHKAGLAFNKNSHDFRKLFRDTDTRSSAKSEALSTKPSNESLRAATARAKNRSNNIQSASSDKVTKADKYGRLSGVAKSTRSASVDSRKSRARSKERRKGSKERSDDLTKMLNRASSYMSLVYVKLPSVALCLSYKGRGNRNFEDIHNLVFTLPTIEYRNKTWSNLDLALALKKDIIRALISHTGTIIGNKFTHHKHFKGQQQSKLREQATRSAVLSSSHTDLAHYDGSAADSVYGLYDSSRTSIDTDAVTPSPRFSDVTESDVPTGRPSYASTSRSMRDLASSSYASSLAPTPESPEEGVEDADSDMEADDSRPPTPKIHVQSASQDFDAPVGDNESSHSNLQGALGTIKGGRFALQRGLSELTHRAHFRKSDYAETVTSPTGSRRGSFKGSNKEAFGGGASQEATEEVEDAKAGPASAFTPKSTFKRILKRSN
ncbi:MAG: hypothetical protein Q9159_000673 [Coniocarpon cinnabarinum]